MSDRRREAILKGSWAVVTGASSGIGLEFCRRLAELGCNLLMISNQPEALRLHASELSSVTNREINAITLDVDLSQPEATQLVADAISQLPEVPLLLINNAGIFDFKPVSALTERRINLYIDLHMRAVAQISRLVATMMASQSRGYILNMSSMSCWMPMPGIALYSATKAFIRAYSRALHSELRDSGISVTAACPGGIATDLFGLPPRLQRLGVRLGVLATPRQFVVKALRMTLRRRKVYINGMLNHIAIPLVAMTPEPVRQLIKHKLLDRR